MMEVVATRCYRVAVTLLERAPALVDIFLQPVVQILVTPPLGDLSLIVKLDFIYQKPRKALCFAMEIGILGRKSSQRICSGRRGGRSRMACVCRNFDHFRSLVRHCCNPRRGMHGRMRREWI